MKKDLVCTLSMDDKLLENISKYSLENKKMLKKSVVCGCYNCMKIFKVVDIVNWSHDSEDDTAICPNCFVDSVIPKYIENFEYSDEFHNILVSLNKLKFANN